MQSTNVTYRTGNAMDLAAVRLAHMDGQLRLLDLERKAAGEAWHER